VPDEVKLNAAIDSYSAQAYGSASDGGDLSRQRALALDAFAGKNFEPAPEGRSQVTDWSVFETIQWILPSLTRIFAGGDDIVEFEPFGPEDEEPAEQESEYLNHLVTQKNNWFLTVLQWCQDALLTKNAYCMAFMEEKIIPESESYEGITEDQLVQLLENDPEVVFASSRLDEDNPEPVIDPFSGQPSVDPFTGQPIMQPRTVYDIELKQTKAEKNLKFKVLPPERTRIAQDTSDFTLDDCNYFEYWDLTTISELRKSGYDVPDDIPDDFFAEAQEDEARDRIYHGDQNIDEADPSMKQVVVRTVWIKYDYDEDGIAELQRVVRVGDVILEREEVSRIPVASIVPFINTHRHIGVSVADLTFDIQRIKTSLLRSGLDSLNLSVNPRHAISDRVNLEDLLVSRPGGVVRLEMGAVPGEGHIMPLQTEFVFPQAQEGLRHMDSVIESRVGVNRIFQGIDESNVNDHDRVGQLSSMAAQRVEQIARIFASGFVTLFAIAHELIIKSGDSDKKIKLRNEWVSIDPTQWRSGRDMKVVAPFAAGNKDSLLSRLMIISGIHEKALAGGLPIVTPQDSYRLAKKIASAADVDGDQLFTDPRNIPPPPEEPDHAMLAIEVENKKADNQARDIEIDAQIKKEEIETESITRQAIAKLQSDTQIAIAQIKGGQSIDLEEVKARFKDAPLQLGTALDATKEINEAVTDSIRQVTEAIDEMKRTAATPIKIVRENGKIIGKEQGGVFTPLEDVG
jgi:hypothetical protein